jgi:hypothetical protein
MTNVNDPTAERFSKLIMFTYKMIPLPSGDTGATENCATSIA